MSSAADSALWRLPAIRKLVVLALLGFTGFAGALASLPWWAVRGGASPSAAGLVTTVMLGVTVLAQFLVPTVERRLGVARTLAIGLVALGAPSPLYLVSDDLARCARDSAGAGGSDGAGDRRRPVSTATAARRGPSVWNAAFDAGTGIGAVVVGALAATGMGVPAALGACAGLVVACLPLAVLSSTRAARPAGLPAGRGVGE